MKYRGSYSVKLYDTILILSNDQITENVMENDKKEKVEDDSSTMEHASHKELKAIMILNNLLLQSDNTTQENSFNIIKS